jgi:hypothetical protein
VYNFSEEGLKTYHTSGYGGWKEFMKIMMGC